MQLLRTLTLASAGVLVAALVAGLVVVLVFLVSTTRNLERVRLSLAAVADAAAGLSRGVERLHGAWSVCATALAEARASLGRADDRLAELTEPADVGGGR
ncbi:MAG: hypothetical protein KY462_06010 [Actinobacteria bacterium]|nr:hypothetical protein [Actinomycetota bacterium]